MQLALSTPSAPPPIPVWGELSEKLRQGFTAKNQAWNPGPNVVNSTTVIALRASLFLEGFRQSHSARYYNPLTGRFMSRDPEDPQLRDAKGIPIDAKKLHKYLYAGGDPVNMIDPTGREDEAAGYALLTGRTLEETVNFAGAIACSFSIHWYVWDLLKGDFATDDQIAAIAAGVLGCASTAVSVVYL